MEREYSQKYLQINRGKSIIFDAEELPFFRVASDLSDLGRNSRVEKDFRDRYSNIDFALGCTVDGAVLIQDILPEYSGRWLHRKN
ncbi:MAG: hypothetical protein ABH816_04000 [Candidatus Levyibacteriota bacterium]